MRASLLPLLRCWRLIVTGGWRLTVTRRLTVTGRVAVRDLGLDDALDSGQLFIAAQCDQADSLRVPTHHGDFVDPRAHERALVAHEHHVVGIEHLHGCDQGTVAIARLLRDHPLRAATLDREIADLRPFAVATFA